jgi:hypothetical protein
MGVVCALTACKTSSNRFDLYESPKPHGPYTDMLHGRTLTTAEVAELNNANQPPGEAPPMPTPPEQAMPTSAPLPQPVPMMPQPAPTAAAPGIPTSPMPAGAASPVPTTAIPGLGQ